ncbi:MAG: TonB-dependent receptor [Pseudomonadota bacterium]|nr:TonB-dependent receptor [Pseudomonadota bacterium]
MIRKKSLVSKPTHWMSRLTFLTGLILAGNSFAQDATYVAPDVNIFESPEQVFELPGSGDYIGPEEIRKYNFNNINEILRNTTGIYSREEDGMGIFPNISIRGVNTLRSAQVNIMEDEINIMPAPYSAPDAYYSPIAGKMHALEILKGTSQYRYGPHSTGGAINYVTTPIDLGQRYHGSVSYGSGNDVITQDYFNYGVTGRYGALAILGEMYYRHSDGNDKAFNLEPPASTQHRKGYDSDELGGINHIAPMVKLLWQLPTTRNITLELKGSYNDMNYNEGYSGLTTADFNADPGQIYVAYQLDEMNSEQQTYYAKLRAEINSNVSNNLTIFANRFTRDWFKLADVNGDSLQSFTSKAGSATSLACAKGTSACTLRYVNNDRQYTSYGLNNETNFKFNTDYFGKNIKHNLTVGYGYHYDSINRDQQRHLFTQAVGGALTGTGTSYKDDRHEKTKGHSGYIEESAEINNFVVSVGGRFEYADYHYRDKIGAPNSTSNIHEDMFAFAPGGGLVYNHDDNWQWFGGVYKGFNLPGPSAARDDGSPVEKETSIAKEIGVRYSTPNFFMSWTGFHTDFKDLIVIDNSNADSAPDNAGNVVTKGFELMTTYAPDNFLPISGDISFYANYTFTNANLDGAATSTDAESGFAGGRDGSNVPYIPDHRLSFGADYEYNDFDFGVNMTYHSESWGTADESETEVFQGSADARNGRIDDAFLLNFYAGYDFMQNYRITAGVNNATDLEYVASRHPSGARRGAPLTAYVKAVANF